MDTCSCFWQGLHCYYTCWQNFLQKMTHELLLFLTKLMKRKIRLWPITYVESNLRKVANLHTMRPNIMLVDLLYCLFLPTNQRTTTSHLVEPLGILTSLLRVDISVVEYAKRRVSFLRTAEFSNKYFTSFISTACPEIGTSISTNSSDDSKHSGTDEKLTWLISSELKFS